VGLTRESRGLPHLAPYDLPKLLNNQRKVSNDISLILMTFVMGMEIEVKLLDDET
jgi:hypothetical protein